MYAGNRCARAACTGKTAGRYAAGCPRTEFVGCAENQNPRDCAAVPPAGNLCAGKQRSQYEQRVEKILRKPTFDEEEARSTIAKYRQENAGKKQEYAEHELQLMRQKHAIFQVLTPEQQEQYLHLHSAHAAYDEY